MRVLTICIVPVLLLSNVEWVATGGKPITCKTSGVVLKGSPANITCLFNHDHKLDKGFNVYRHASGRSPAMIVALCGWEKDKLNCRNFDGFTVKSAEGKRQVTFGVDSAKRNHLGSYVCKTLPADEAEATECQLTLPAIDVLNKEFMTCSTITTSAGKEVSMTCMTPKLLDMNGVIFEKFDNNNGRRKEVIANCNKNGEWSVKDYVRNWKTPKQLIKTMPHVSDKQVGLYVCGSSSLLVVNEFSTMKPAEDENSGKDQPLEQLQNTMYGILACFVVLPVAVTVALVYTFRRRKCSSDKTGNNNEINTESVTNQGVDSRKPLIQQTGGK